jgi:hypothetical protein
MTSNDEVLNRAIPRLIVTKPGDVLLASPASRV